MGRDVIVFLLPILPDVGRNSLPHGFPDMSHNFNGAAQDFSAFNFPPQGH